MTASLNVPTQDTADDSPYTAAGTRPAVASRKARRPKEPRKVTRYTLDLEAEQHMFLRLLAIQEGVEASKICRALLYLLEADPSLRERVLDEIFAADDVAGE
jgi:hypothetical protein